MSLKAHPQRGSTTVRLMVFKCVICRTSEAHGWNFKGVQKDLEKEVYYMPYSNVDVKLPKGCVLALKNVWVFRNGKTCSGAMLRLDLACG